MNPVRLIHQKGVMVSYAEKQETVHIITDILCNKCGLSCKKTVYGQDDYYGLIEATVTGGFASEDLEDATTYHFSICEKCLAEVFGSFRYKPTKDAEFVPGVDVPETPKPPKEQALRMMPTQGLRNHSS